LLLVESLRSCEAGPAPNKSRRFLPGIDRIASMADTFYQEGSGFALFFDWGIVTSI
jgi:hypothetical protein